MVGSDELVATSGQRLAVLITFGRENAVLKDTLFVYSMDPYRKSRTASCSTIAFRRNSSVMTMAAYQPAREPNALRSIAVIGAEYGKYVNTCTTGLFGSDRTSERE